MKKNWNDPNIVRLTNNEQFMEFCLFLERFWGISAMSVQSFLVENFEFNFVDVAVAKAYEDQVFVLGNEDYQVFSMSDAAFWLLFSYCFEHQSRDNIIAFNPESVKRFFSKLMKLGEEKKFALEIWNPSGSKSIASSWPLPNHELFSYWLCDMAQAW